MTYFSKVAYVLGRTHALMKLGMGTADDFAGLIEQDGTAEAIDQEAPEVLNEDKPVHWGGGASLEGGDTGTRQEEMGLPSNAAV